MNRRCYRHIINRSRGELQVVSELARGCGTPPAQGSAVGRLRQWVTLRPLALLIGLAVSATPVLAAGIIADGRAPDGQRPQIINTQNGLPQVNIAAPNHAGLSHNQYQQFDVDKRGAILNNSATMTQTQLAGMVQGNANLNGRKPARVILNEVNSNSPSQLKGYLEVAGTQAQVIVANRPPSPKNSPFATTGTQANFETYKLPTNAGKPTKPVKIGNGHLNILD